MREKLSQFQEENSIFVVSSSTNFQRFAKPLNLISKRIRSFHSENIIHFTKKHYTFSYISQILRFSSQNCHNNVQIEYLCENKGNKFG